MSLRQGVCPECHHQEVIVTTATYYLEDVEVPIFVVPHLTRLREGYGELSLITCRSCGYSQMWAANPGEIPIGDDYNTRLFKG